MWLTGLAAPRHVRSSQTGARTRVPCIAGGFSTTAPPGKPLFLSLLIVNQKDIFFSKTKRILASVLVIQLLLLSSNSSFLDLLCDSGAGLCEYFSFTSWQNIRFFSVEANRGELQEEGASLFDLGVSSSMLWRPMGNSWPMVCMRLNYTPSSDYFQYPEGNFLASITGTQVDNF